MMKAFYGLMVACLMLSLVSAGNFARDSETAAESKDRLTNQEQVDESGRRTLLRDDAVSANLVDRIGFRDEAYARIAEMTGAEGISPGQGDADAMAACDKKLLDDRAKRSDEQRPSMAQDMVKGRPTEIDFINGFVVRSAEAHGIAVPANAGIVAAIKAIEAGKMTPSPEAIADI